MYNSGENIQITNTEDIDLQDQTFKLSKNVIKEDLKMSIRRSGILENPVLLKKAGRHVVLFGHNRLKVLSELNTKIVKSLIIHEIDPVSYIRYALLKNYRGEIGPFGKIKLISIIKKFLNYDPDDVNRIARDELNLPDAFTHDRENIDKAISIPDELKNYIDAKDMNFRTIRDVLNLEVIDDGRDKLDYRIDNGEYDSDDKKCRELAPAVPPADRFHETVHT